MRTEEGRPLSGGRWALFTGLGVAAALLAGIGIGALLAAQNEPAVPVAAELQGEREELEHAQYFDVGSLRAVAERDGVVLWEGTRNQGESVCILLTDAAGKVEEGGSGCGAEDAEILSRQQAPAASISLPDEDGNPTRSLFVSRYVAASGEPVFVPFITSMHMDGEEWQEAGWGPGGVEEHEALVEAVTELDDAETGHGYSLDRLGSDGRMSIWSVTEWGDEPTIRLALVDSEHPAQISFSELYPETSLAAGEEVIMSRADEEAGEDIAYALVEAGDVGQRILVIERTSVREKFVIEVPGARSVDEDDDD